MIDHYHVSVALGDAKIRTPKGLGRRVLRLLRKAGLDVHSATITVSRTLEETTVFPDAEERAMKRGIYKF